VNKVALKTALNVRMSSIVRVKISNRFSALENIDAEVGIDKFFGNY
jgi:hypothetical protein